MLITVTAAGHGAAFGRAGGSLVTVPAAGHRTYGLEEPSGWKGRGVMRARRDAARPSGPVAVP